MKWRRTGLTDIININIDILKYRYKYRSEHWSCNNPDLAYIAGKTPKMCIN